MGGQSLPLFSFVLFSLTSYHIDDIYGKHIMASVGDFSWVSASLSMAGISYTILCLHHYQKRLKNLKTKLSDTVGWSSDTPTFKIEEWVRLDDQTNIFLFWRSVDQLLRNFYTILHL